jgi:hypothetical protein
MVRRPADCGHREAHLVILHSMESGTTTAAPPGAHAAGRPTAKEFRTPNLLG